MEYVFGICAVLGGTVMVCQFAMSVLGLGGDDADGADADPDDVFGGGDHHGSNWLFGVLSFRSIVAALAFFGIAGLAARQAGSSHTISLAVAIAVGLAAMYGVYAIMRGLQRLRADGTVRISAALGRPGTVYLRVPAAQAGRGKVQVTVDHRVLELEALTSGAELPTGAKVVVTRIIDGETIEVAADQGET